MTYWPSPFMTNVMVLAAILSISHSFLAAYHLTVLPFPSSEDIHDTAHIMMTLDITTGTYLVDQHCHKALLPD